MGRMRRIWAVWMLVAGLAAAGRVSADETVVFQTASGQLLRAAEDGSLRADRLVPSPAEMFTLVSGENGRIVGRTSDGCTLATGPGGQLRVVAGTALPEPFSLVQVEGNRAALRGPISWLLLDAAAAESSPKATPYRPRPEETIGLFRVGHVPSLLQQEFGRLIRKAVVAELGEKAYEKTRTRKKQKFVKMWAPTLRDLKRQKRRLVVSVPEEYHVRVQLCGEPEIHVVDMPYLQGYYDPAAGAVMFTVQATLPLEGRVGYKIPDVLSASTGFRTVVWLTASGAIQSKKDQDQMTLCVPELLELDVGIRELDISNDGLNILREPLEDMINEELREKKDRIREKANKSIRKAVETRVFRTPILKWLLVPLK